MKKTTYAVLLMTIILAVTGCGRMPQHVGTIPENITPDEDISYHDEFDKYTYSEITCAEGERQVYFIGWDTPSLTLLFNDKGKLSIFQPSYQSVKLAPGKRDFVLHFNYRTLNADIKVKQFDFEPKTKYFARYSTDGRRIKVWIEKEDGTIVYGTKPEEGTF